MTPPLHLAVALAALPPANRICLSPAPDAPRAPEQLGFVRSVELGVDADGDTEREEGDGLDENRPSLTPTAPVGGRLSDAAASIHPELLLSLP
jgi:hypothetical protein